MSRVICAMSGGVDSSVAALLLKQAGHEVIGVSMKLSDTPTDPSVQTSGCCSVKDFNDARAICDSLQIPFYAMNFKEPFKKKVMDNFVSEYLLGRTPNPCVLCNQEIKFDAFLAKAQELQADYVATGHYAQIHQDPQTKTYSLFRGKDRNKDQTYFLFSLQQNELSKILFPVGHLTKPEVRAIAREYHLKTKDKPESQEVCFVPNDDPGAFIDSYAPESVSGSGEFIDESGKVLGEHPGIHYFTIGQRRGTQVAMGKRFYVKSIDPQTKRITLAEDASLFHQELIADQSSWTLSLPRPEEKIQAKIRYRTVAAECVVRSTDSRKIQVTFTEAQRAITPGQAIVFYQGEQVLGGAWIEKPL
ncbi:MAG: tRNA 2-thiouridine(34) synthase MnmA [Deltaproteobacteria bacterium]|nr:tRNA 2-thiouridine(34) synthase MnmA [Deltaproteobacteria bacterium]